MTENEAVKKVKEFGLYHSIGDLPYSKLTVEAFEMAVKALEEIQQYRAIGTVDDIQRNAERKWIPVEECLPEPNRDVLVSIQELGEDAVSISMDCILEENGRMFWGICSAGEKVLAWMPLPMEYKSGEKVTTVNSKVAYSFDNEHYYGCFDTEAEARAEAVIDLKYRTESCPENMPEYVYIGECELFEPSLSGSSWDIIDAIQCQAYDEGHGDYADDYLRVSKEKQEELEAELEQVFQEWVERYNLYPDFYTVNKYDVYKYDTKAGKFRLVRSGMMNGGKCQ